MEGEGEEKNREGPEYLDQIPGEDAAHPKEDLFRPFHRLFVMVGFAPHDGKGSVKLLHEHQAHQLVGEGHFGEGELLVRQVIDGLGKAVGPADYEDQVPGTVGQFSFQILRPSQRGEVSAPFVEQDHPVPFPQAGEDQFPFPRFDLVAGQRGRLLQSELQNL